MPQWKYIKCKKCISCDAYNTTITGLHLCGRQMHGSIPSQLGELRALTVLDLFSNGLGGSIPTELSLLTGLTKLDLGKNSLRGSIPTQLGVITKLTSLQLNNNRLTGPIPFSINGLSGLNIFRLDENSLTGPIPTQLGGLTGLTYLGLNSNNLSGSIPPQLGGLIKLKYLYLYENSLEGSIDVFFSDNNFPVLKFLDLSQNAFTSGLDNLKTFPLKLQFLALAINCFRGKFDFDSLCGARNLHTLILDGLSSQKSCQQPIYLGGMRGALVHAAAAVDNPLAFNAYMITPLDGRIPGCIFGLPNITTLHASGNGLKGSLSNVDKMWGANLRHVSLSYNTLTGGIPLALQRRAANMDELDLEYNCFKGSIHDMSVNSSGAWVLRLEVNRLSGFLPPDLVTARGSIAVLADNVFNCKFYEGKAAGLPQADPDHLIYECASRIVDMYMAGFAGAVCMCVVYTLVQIFVYKRFKRFRSLIATSLFRAHLSTKERSLFDLIFGKTARFENSLHITSFVNVLSDCRAVALLLGTLCLAFLMPLYATMKVSAPNPTHSLLHSLKKTSKKDD